MEAVWRTGVVPQDWMDAELVLLYKKEGRLQCDNYCGISILSVPGNVLPLILLEDLNIIIEPQLMEAQCGFRGLGSRYNGPDLDSQAISREVTGTLI